MTKIVHHIRDCVRIITGVQQTDGPLQVKYWGVRTPAALMPMVGTIVRLSLTDQLAVIGCQQSRQDLRLQWPTRFWVPPAIWRQIGYCGQLHVSVCCLQLYPSDQLFLTMVRASNVTLLPKDRIQESRAGAGKSRDATVNFDQVKLRRTKMCTILGGQPVCLRPIM